MLLRYFKGKPAETSGRKVIGPKVKKPIFAARSMREIQWKDRIKTDHRPVFTKAANYLS